MSISFAVWLKSPAHATTLVCAASVCQQLFDLFEREADLLRLLDETNTLDSLRAKNAKSSGCARGARQQASPLVVSMLTPTFAANSPMRSSDMASIALLEFTREVAQDNTRAFGLKDPMPASFRKARA